MTRLDLLQGTLDVLILKSVALAPRHGYGIVAWIEAQTDAVLLVEEGALYPALHRLEERGLVTSEWGLSENNRRAKYYRLTGSGRAALRAETRQWNRYAAAVAKVLG